ncbi:ankyrin repeat domain-containing protein [Leptospira yasudae]|uniref:ankyrin repeat domain-containing protein n=1 Tax=Leptospira yasudae TaxID=2202201 RepID=UPI001C4EA860|nr:ankyrin repeat domain-containing protein [Leptospira yasudae]MBW0432707.1 ankyrin repeat domain-containing protein [Leptospira yasudae]
MVEEKISHSSENTNEKNQSSSFWKRFIFFGAIKKGNVSKVQNVLEKGFDPNANLYHGVTPLSLSIKYERLEIVRTLLKFSADPNLADENTGLTPLLHCIIEDSPLEMMNALIQGNADLNQKDRNGMSPLHHCVNEGKLEPFRLLLESGADPNVQDFDGVTCMNLAKSSHGMSEFAELLLKHGADPMIKDKHGKIYLM